MQKVGIVLNCEGMGDCLYAIPVIRKLYQQNSSVVTFDIFTHNPSLFTRCPYVDKVYSIKDQQTLSTYSQFNQMLELFVDWGMHHSHIDTVDLISMPLKAGTLTFREKQLEYYPTEPDTAQHYDVVINTSITWATRTWPAANWQRLADMLVAKGYSVAVVGKDVASEADGMTKKSPPLQGCVNLVNQLSLDQTYYTIGKCGLFITSQNGLSVLAGATDVNMVVLGISIEWGRRAVYRKQDPHYKVRYVEGGCTLHCGEQRQCMKPGFNGLKDDLYECQPSYEQVERAVLEQLENPASRPTFD